MKRFIFAIFTVIFFADFAYGGPKLDSYSVKRTNDNCLKQLKIGESEKPCNPKASYPVCEIPSLGLSGDCKNSLPSHATAAKCDTAGRTGYKICVATACDPNGYTLQGGRCVKTSNSSNSNPQNNSTPTGNTLQVDDSTTLTCVQTKTRSYNDCVWGAIVEGQDGKLYKCQDNAWRNVPDNSLPECKQDLATLAGLGSSNEKKLYIGAKTNDSDWIYYHEYREDQGCPQSVKQPCKYPFSEYTQKETECEKKGGLFLSTHNENDDTKFVECDTTGVENRAITVTDNKGNKLSDVNVKWRDQPYTTDQSGNVTLPIIPGSKQFQITLSKQGFETKSIVPPDIPTNNIIVLNPQSNATQPETVIPTSDAETNCKNTGGDEYKDGKCICDADKHLTEYEYTHTDKTKHSICKCVKGYHRNGEPDENGKYDATYGECITETHQEINTAQWQKDTEAAYRNEYDNAQSDVNKAITAGSTLLTGEGAMMAARAFFEQRADARAETEMANYIGGMGCEYGGGQTVNLGDDVTLPTGDLTDYYTEYKQTADKLKETKAALNLRPGIESEVLYDQAQSGLYQYKTAEIQSGGNISLARALMNPDGEDAEKWNAQRAKTTKDLWTGVGLAATGAAVGAIASHFANKNHKKKYLELEQEMKDVVTRIENEYPEIFTPTTDPVEVVIIEPAQPEEPETPVAEKMKVTINQKAKAGAFESGGVTLTDTGRQGITEAINQYVTAIGTHTDISNIKITAIGHADPQQIKNVTRITSEYNTALKDSYLFTADRISKIDSNENLTKARAQIVINALIEAILANYALPENAKRAEYDAQGTTGDDCKETQKIEFKKCRYVDITIEFEGYKKSE